MANFIDKTIGFFSPKAGFKRAQFRAAMESQTRRYEGAADGRRHANWLTKSNPSVNQLITKDLKNLVSRSRELSINNPYAKSAPGKIANSVVGTGILPTPFIEPVIENGQVKPVKSADKFIELAKEAWKQWAGELSCDYNGDYDFYGLQYLAMRTIIVSGEVLAIRKKVTTDINSFGFQILMLEADYIDTSKVSEKDDDGGYTYYGIKYDKLNKRSGYWLFDRHPSETNATSVLVPIADVIHVYDVDRAGQNRGVPAASSTLLKQRDLDDYEDAELLGKKAQACMPVFVTNSEVETAPGDAKEPVESIEPGMVNYLNSGEQVTLSSPPASSGFGEFTKTQHRAIANGYMLSYEAFTGDYSNVNFSSGRMGWIEFQRQVYNWQYLMLIPKFCNKAFAWFAEQLIVAKGFPKEIILKASWTPPRREMIDPVKETNAKRIAMRSGLQSWSETVRQDGYNPEEVIAEYKKDYEGFKSAGIVADWTPAFENDVKIAQANANKNTAPKQ